MCFCERDGLPGRYGSQAGISAVCKVTWTFLRMFSGNGVMEKRQQSGCDGLACPHHVCPRQDSSHRHEWVKVPAVTALEPLTPQEWGVGVLARFPGHSESSGLDPGLLSCGLTAPVCAGHVSSVDLGQGNQGNCRDTW